LHAISLEFQYQSTNPLKKIFNLKSHNVAKTQLSSLMG
jgi:hypothetical protein